MAKRTPHEQINALYLRVSSLDQKTENQRPDLERWACRQEEGAEWFEDHFTGRTMQRPAWGEVMALCRAGRVRRVAVWRLDRLGRTVPELVTLFEELDHLGVELVSIHDGISGNTLAGKLIRTILAAVASFELELMRERVKAGQARARARGKTWGGSKKGVFRKISPAVEKMIVDLLNSGCRPTVIARRLHLSRQSIYEVKARNKKPGG